MKILLALLLIASTQIAKADLFDQRAAASAAEQEAASQQARIDYAAVQRGNLYTLAQSFGASHGGVSQFSENTSGFNGYVRSLHFVSGDGYACEAYDLTYFTCYDSSNHETRFWRDQYIKRVSDYGPWVSLHGGHRRR